MNYADIPIGDDAPQIVPAVIEIPRRSRNKYVYDLEHNIFRLKRVLHAAVEYPAAYGFIPSTHWDDDEPLDVLVLTSEHFSPGVFLHIRPIGILVMEDGTAADSKILSVPVQDPKFNDIQDLPHISVHVLREIEHFFESYKHLEGHDVRSFGWNPVAFAHQAIRRGMKLYEEVRS